jgi:hypothetical protein
MAEDVTLRLSIDEAVVLFDWVRRFNSGGLGRFEDQAEQRVLWNLEASLEKALVEPFKPEFAEILRAARSRVRDPSE